MSNASNNQGRAYEFICLLSLSDAINAIRPAQVIHNTSYDAAQRAWETLSVDEVAKRWGTINYEVVCGLADRLPRIYNE